MPENKTAQPPSRGGRIPGPRVQLAISSHGYGHLSQAIALAQALFDLWPAMALRVQCALAPEVIAERLGDIPFEHDRRTTDIGLIMRDPIHPDLHASHRAYARLHADLDSQIRQEAEGLRTWGCDLLIADIPYLPLAAAARSGIPSVALASLSWDQIIAAYFDLHHSEPARWHSEIRAAYAQANLALLPEPAMSGDCFTHRQPIPPIVLPGKFSPGLRPALGIDPADRRPLILCSLGGIPAATLPIDAMAQQTDFHWMVNISLNAQHENLHCQQQLPDKSYQAILSSVDGIVSKPGYGTAVEAAAHGLPFVFCRRGDFPDEAGIIHWLSRHARIAEISHSQWQAGDFSQPMRQLLASPPCTPPLCNGAEIGARHIAAFFDRWTKPPP